MAMTLSPDLLVAHPPKTGGTSATAYLEALRATSWVPLTRQLKRYPWQPHGHQPLRAVPQLHNRHV